ncbi:MAG: hypothetical protein CVT67_05855 [Actinobacteria bacterium HGW-Actinobacteria-7]|nr:MAG: hypothetical protein CVT67_05855 [Actinobacteria bacterium HGW-Actinobacteria-7]
MAGNTGTTGHRGLVLAGVLLALVAAGIVWWTGTQSRTTPGTLEVAGDVRAESYTVMTPAITVPAADYTVGIPKPVSTAGAPLSAGRPASSSSMARNPIPVVAGVLVRVDVEQGDHVVAGQVIAKLDTALLDLGVEQAKATAARARTDVDVIKGNLDTVADNQSSLSSARTKLSSGEAQLVKARSDLLKARKQLVTARSKAIAGRTAIKKQITALEKLIAGSPTPPSPSPTPTPGPTPAQLLAALKAKLAEVNKGIAKADAGLKKIDAGLAKVKAGFSQLVSARTKLATGASALSDAKTQLTNAKDLLGVVAEGREIGVAVAEAARDAAEITAPVSGVITYVRTQDTVAIVGSPVARITPDGASKVDTYLVAEQLAGVGLGDAARVGLDSFPGRSFSGTVTQIGTSFGFAPTRFPTELVHMARAVMVTVTLDDSATLPAGTPVDLTITTR